MVVTVWEGRRAGAGMGKGSARGGENERKADFLVDYKRFAPRVTKAFTEGGIVHVEEDDRSHSLATPAGSSEFFTTPSDGRSPKDRRSFVTPGPLPYGRTSSRRVFVSCTVLLSLLYHLFIAH